MSENNQSEYVFSVLRCVLNFKYIGELNIIM